MAIAPCDNTPDDFVNLSTVFHPCVPAFGWQGGAPGRQSRPETGKIVEPTAPPASPDYGHGRDHHINKREKAGTTFLRLV